MSLNRDAIQQLKDTCGELVSLPKGWTFYIVNDRGNQRVAFEKTGTDTRQYIHPNLGALPSPWILRVVTNKAAGEMQAEYFNRETKKSSSQDPRFAKKVLTDQKKHIPRELAHTAAMVKNRTGLDVTKMRRAQIRDKNIRDHYQIVHTIDSGGGELGAMNGGVFVVRIKNIPNHHQLFVEKRFKNDELSMELAVSEITMLERCKHPALTCYVAAFILPDLSDASVYVEFCDRGSLQDLIKAYGNKSHKNPRPMVPEGFIWHFFTGLCDALAYLQGGSIFFRNKDAVPQKDWVPIIHRDIKPDNILLRSRSTVGSKRYFYCVLSDFGLACNDLPKDDEDCDDWQKIGLKLGTKSYWAPELLNDPYPKTNDDRQVYPNGNRHSARSDLWAIGASVVSLCIPHPSQESHLDWSTRHDPPEGENQMEDWYEGTISHHKKLIVPDPYSQHLRDAVLRATEWEVHKRPDPITMIRELEKIMIAAGALEQGSSELLPHWATKVHAYHNIDT